MESTTVDQQIIKAGMLRKKGSRVTTWGERYFVLKGHNLLYYIKSSDTEVYYYYYYYYIYFYYHYIVSLFVDKF